MKVAIDFHIYEEYFVILHPIMTGYFKRAAMLTVIILFVAGCHTPHSGGRVDLRLRARVDSYNKQSFMNRYQDPQVSIRYAYDALHLLRDSLPAYHDGILRAYNNLSFGYYMLAEQDSAQAYIDSVLTLSESLSHPLLNKSNNITTPTPEKTATNCSTISTSRAS